MKRILVSATFLVAGGFIASAPRPADAQVTAGIHVSWQWSDDGWQPGPVVNGYVDVIDRAPRRGGGYASPARVRPVPRPRFHVPPGHLPPPGMCRAWVIGRPAGHQPPPTSCGRAFRNQRGPGVVILHTPAPGGGHELGHWDGPDRDRWIDWNEGRGDRDWDDDRWEDDRWEDARWEDHPRDGDRDGRPARGRGG